MARNEDERDDWEMTPEELLPAAVTEAMGLYDPDAEEENGDGPVRRRRRRQAPKGQMVHPTRGGGEDYERSDSVRLTPGQIDYIWDKFTKDHGHRDAEGNVVWTERLQEEVGIEAGLKPLFARSRHGDARAAEVIMRMCLARPLAPLDQRVAVMDKQQVNTRLQLLTAALQEAGVSLDQIEAAARRALPPATEKEKL